MGVLSTSTSSSRRSERAALAACSVLLLAALACPGDGLHRGRGIVEAVEPEQRQALISHDAIAGLMPEMTMNFDVPDEAVFEKLAPGQVIEFGLQADGRVYRIVEVEVVGQAGVRDGFAKLGNELVRFTPAPDFSLIDQDGKERSLASLRGRPVLLDFIFTHCPGPCPILTSRHVSVQRALSPDVAAKAWLVSVSLDPARDTPEAMRRYALARGVDFDNWAFLTGDADAIDAVLSGYGIGRVRSDEGEIEHVVGAFLIDGEGRMVRRYLGLEHAAEDIAADLAALASAGGGQPR